MRNLIIRVLQENDINSIVTDFKNEGIDRNEEYFRSCLDEMENDVRVTFVALEDNHFIGAAHFLYYSNYPQHQARNIPEINDLVVIPSWRNKGIGAQLLEEIESFAYANNYDRIGLGVGLYRDYSSAQRLYIKRGYIPDKYGVFYNYKEMEPGEVVRLDDELNLCLTKHLGR